MTSKKSNPLRIILTAGLIAGTLDIAAACIQFYINTGRGPVLVLRYIASGVFGRERASEGGDLMIFLGLGFHYVIALSFAAFFYLLYTNWKFLSRNIILSGFVYGIFVWVVMNLIIVPLSKVSSPPFAWNKALIAMAILITMIGIPIALITRRMVSSPTTH